MIGKIVAVYVTRGVELNGLVMTAFPVFCKVRVSSFTLVPYGTDARFVRLPYESISAI